MVEKMTFDKGIKPFRQWRLYTAGLAFLACAVGLAFWLGTRSHRADDHVSRTTEKALPKVRAMKQITNDGLPKNNLIGDGARLYFNELSDGRWRLMQLAVASDQVTPLADNVPNAKILDVSPESELLVSTAAALNNGGSLSPKITPLWVMLPNGSSRRLGKILGFAGAWAPGGKVVFSKARDLYTAEQDGSNHRKILTAPGPILGVKFSPDRSLMRLTIGVPDTRFALWEAKPDGTNLRPILPLPGAQRPMEVCCGSWTKDGHYFVYEDLSELWIRNELLDQSSRPKRLTSGEILFHTPIPSDHGSTIFAIGERKHSQSRNPVSADIYTLDLEL